VPLLGSSRQVIGHLVILNDRPMEKDPLWISVLETFASRAGAELERQEADGKLRAALAQVEDLKNRLQAENLYLQEEIRTEHNFEEIVGNSPALLEALAQVEQVAGTDSTVLLQGETGSGKEVFARAIHARSARRDRPLVKVNCGAIPAGLVESELFGHVRGAFTGALEKRIGRFELAHGGTIFLDEVVELPLDTQVKLLRVLQEKEFEPVGGSRTVHVDVRVLAASNRNLEEAVRSGTFRADLLYRLNVFPITIPLLRQRRSDIPLLVTFFLASLSKRLGKRLDGFSRGSMERLSAYSWPGNVRELQNVIERAAVLARGPVLEIEKGLLPTGPVSGLDAEGSVTLEELERSHIRAALKSTGGIVEGPHGAASILGLHPNTLRSRIRRLGIERGRPHEIS
jgi:formate hydrogenlyase transcriptional activator